MGSTGLSRRAFLHFAAGALAAAGVPSRARAQAMDAMTALSLTGSVLGAASAFASSGGGLEAMLQAQNQKLDLIVEQLSQISNDLSALRVEVSRLPSVIEGLLRYQYRDALINNIVGAGRRFTTLYRSERYEPGNLRTEEARAQLHDVLTTSQQLHSNLASLPEGRGPEAAAVATLALSTQLAAMGHLGFGRGLKLSTLDDYEKWIGEMRSDSRGSIWDIAKDVSNRHDVLLKDLAGTPVWRDFALDGARMGSASATISGTSHDPCNLLCDWNTIQNQVDIVPPVDYHLVAAICPIGWGSDAQLVFKEDPVLKARMLEYTTGPGKVIVTTVGDACTTQRWPSSQHGHQVYSFYTNGRLSSSEIESITRGNRNVFDTRRTTIKAKVAELNYYRARAAQCQLAFGLLDNLSAALRKFKSYLL